MRTVTSDVINDTASTSKDEDLKIPQVEQDDKPGKRENMVQGINIVSATNCTISIDYQ